MLLFCFLFFLSPIFSKNLSLFCISCDQTADFDKSVSPTDQPPNTNYDQELNTSQPEGHWAQSEDNRSDFQTNTWGFKIMLIFYLVKTAAFSLVFPGWNWWWILASTRFDTKKLTHYRNEHSGELSEVCTFHNKLMCLFQEATSLLTFPPHSFEKHQFVHRAAFTHNMLPWSLGYASTMVPFNFHWYIKPGHR